MCSLRNLSFVMLAVIVGLLMSASLVEKVSGSATHIYGSWWFAAAWAMLAVAAVGYCLRRRLQRRPSAFVLHLSFVVILLGALVTHIWGVRGMVHLREGLPVSGFVTDDQRVERLPFALVLDGFEVLCDPGTDVPSDYRSTLRQLPPDAALADPATLATMPASTLVISMNRIARLQGYRFYQSSYDADLHGSILAVCHDPWGIGITYVGYGLLFVSMVLMLLLPREGFRRLLSQLSPAQRRTLAVVLAAAVGVALFVVSRIYAKPLQPVLRSPFLGIHVGIIVVAYTLLGVNFVSGIVGLIRSGRVADGGRASLQLSRALLFPALFCLAAGIFIGALWANVSWGRYWGWDPKEVWALITMLVYAFAFHAQSLPAFSKPRFFHAYMVLAFLTVLMTYYGVNILLGGMHSYA